MATVGTKRTIPFTVGTGAGAIVGQGSFSEPWLLYSKADADAPAVWLDATDKLRAYSTSRGRETELADVDAGTATFTLDDRDHDFDPAFGALDIRPMNRWWLQEGFSGTMHSVFYGYAESYQEKWVKGSEDAATIVSCVDEFKVLALDQLPITEPPRDSYQDVVMYDLPDAYWPMDSVQGVLGDAWYESNLATMGTAEGGIVGQDPSKATVLTGTHYLFQPDSYGDAGRSGYADGLSEFTVEFWFQWGVALPTSSELLVRGPLSATTWSYRVSFSTTGTLVLEAKNSGGTNHSVTSAALTNALEWHHVVGTITGGSLRLYVNGVEAGSTAWTGVIGTSDAFARMSVGNEGTTISTSTRYFDELSFHRAGLDATRILAHYTAGHDRGFARSQLPGARITSVLDAAGSTAPRNIRTGVRTMTGSYMTGQSPLAELRKAELADSIDAVLFIAKDGTITFLDDGHRSVSPWDTVQATFDDDGTDLPYFDIEMDFSDAFLANEWKCLEAGGSIVNTATNVASIATYGRRPQSMLDLPITSLGGGAAAIATGMLTKYLAPLTRITRFELVPATANGIDGAFDLEIGDRIRVFRTRPGGTRIDETIFVQKISVTGLPGQPRRFVLAVSPV